MSQWLIFEKTEILNINSLVTRGNQFKIINLSSDI